MTSPTCTLTAAIHQGDLRQVDALIRSKSIDINAPLTTAGERALSLAAQFGHAAIVDALLTAGANVDGVDNFNRTACHAAARNGHLDALRVLLARQPNLDRADANGRTPLDVAVQYSTNGAVTMLIEAEAPLDSARSVCRAAATSSNAVRALRARGVALSVLRDENGFTPLHILAQSELATASRHAHLSDLVECGIDVDARDVCGDTASHLASRRGDDELLRWLVAVGADVDCANNRGLTPLHHACLDGHVTAGLLLIAAGANVNSCSGDGKSPCRLVAEPALLHAVLAAGGESDVDGDSDSIARARRRLASMRLDFVRRRAVQVCIGLHARQLDALQMCEVLVHACGPVAPLIPFHHWWTIVTIVKYKKFTGVV
jgi:ankyrin repeat protein